jgi:hypothetical protein
MTNIIGLKVNGVINARNVEVEPHWVDELSRKIQILLSQFGTRLCFY